MSNLLQRILSAVLLLPPLFLSIWTVNPHWFAGIVLVAAVLGVTEFFSLTSQMGTTCVRWLGYLAVISLLGLFHLNLTAWIGPAFAAVLAGMMIQAVLTAKTPEDFRAVLPSQAATLFGIVYVGLLAGFLVGVRQITPPHRSSQLLTTYFLIVMAGDTFAYFAGKAFGKHKLSPAISPGKTVEGSIGGIVGSIALALVAHGWFFPELPVGHAVGLGLTMNVLGQFGDLFESLLKRGSGVKDAASIIPGHGGLLDRLDSLLLNAPVLYYYALLTSR